MVAALVLAGGACGGDDDDVTDDAAATTDGSNDEADAGDDDGGGDGGGEWCDMARDIDSSTLFDDIDISDPDSVENAYEAAIELMEDAADSAPDEIEDDVETMIDGTKELVDALRDVDFDIAAIDPSIVFDAEAEAAAERITEYGERVCGIEADTGDLDDTGDTGDTIDLGELGDVGDTGGTDAEIAREQMVSVFTLMGMTDEQANCVVDNIDLENLDELENVDPSEYFDLFDDCGFDLANPGG
jgi:hypothetical protein